MFRLIFNEYYFVFIEFYYAYMLDDSTYEYNILARYIIMYSDAAVLQVHDG